MTRKLNKDDIPEAELHNRLFVAAVLKACKVYKQAPMAKREELKQWAEDYLDEKVKK